MNPTPEAILIDVGGVLVRLSGSQLADFVWRHFKVQVSSSSCSRAVALADYAGYVAGIPAHTWAEDGMPQVWASELSLPKDAGSYVWHRVSAEASAFWIDVPPIARKMLTIFRSNGIPLAAVSEASGGSLSQSLVAKGLEKDLDQIIDSSVVGLHKPQPEIYHEAATQLGADISRCCYISDTHDDLLGAQAAGIPHIFHYNRFRLPTPSNITNCTSYTALIRNTLELFRKDKA